ncbi:Pre-rRNA-processing protein TSR2 [Trinorchestia longiramus]|nr:Pre-rRNA-processing protein TSR2 [Trinorchestia longiramus]
MVIRVGDIQFYETNVVFRIVLILCLQSFVVMDSSPPTFEQTIRAAFRGWDALQFAVDQHAGGLKSREIAEWMVGATEQYFKENQDLQADEVADVLCDIMEEELHVDVCDGSDKTIGEFLCKMYNLIQRKEFDAVHSEMSKLPSYNPSLFTIQTEADPADVGLSVVSSIVNNREGESSSDDSDEEPKELTEQEKMEAEGWTYVKKGGRRKPNKDH